MSATTYNTFADTGYFANIANAARQLVAALFAVKPVVSQRNKEDSLWWLNRLAADSELHSPNLAAELRYIASRG